MADIQNKKDLWSSLMCGTEERLGFRVTGKFDAPLLRTAGLCEVTSLAPLGLPVTHMPFTTVCQLPMVANYPWLACGCRLPEVCQLSAVCRIVIPWCCN